MYPRSNLGIGLGKQGFSSGKVQNWISQKTLICDGPRHFFFHRTNVVARGATSFHLGVLVDFVMDR